MRLWTFITLSKTFFDNLDDSLWNQNIDSRMETLHKGVLITDHILWKVFDQSTFQLTWMFLKKMITTLSCWICHVDTDVDHQHWTEFIRNVFDPFQNYQTTCQFIHHLHHMTLHHHHFRSFCNSLLQCGNTFISSEWIPSSKDGSTTQPTLFIPQYCNLLLRSDRNNKCRMSLRSFHSRAEWKWHQPKTSHSNDTISHGHDGPNCHGDALDPQMDTTQYRYWIKMKYLLCELIVEGEEFHLTSVTVHTNLIYSKNM